MKIRFFLLVLFCSCQKQKLDVDTAPPQNARASDRSNTGVFLPKDGGRLKPNLEIADLNLPQLRAKWSSLDQSDLSTNQKQEIRESILYKIIDLEGIDSALGIVTTLPPGLNRHGLIESIFSYSNQPFADLIKIRSDLTDAKDREAAFLELEYQIRVKGKYSLDEVLTIDLTEDSNGRLLSSSIRKLVEDLKTTVGHGDGSSDLKSRPQIFDIASKLEKLLESGKLSKIDAESAVKHFTWYPEASWALLCGDSPQIKGLLEANRSAIISGMANQSPERAIEVLTSSSHSRDSDIEIVLDSWRRLDSIAPVTWFEKNSNELSPEIRGFAISSFARSALEFGDWEAYERWSKEVPEGSKKSEIIESLDNQLNLKLRDLMSKSPNETIRDLSIESSHSPARIKAFGMAFENWLQSDPGKANGWNEENYASLAAPLQDKIAYLYAIQSLNIGDPLNARLWINQIHDFKTKNNVASELNLIDNE